MTASTLIHNAVVKARKESASKIKPIEIILLNYSLPRLNGINAVKKMRDYIESLNSNYDKSLLVEMPRFILIMSSRASDLEKEAKVTGVDEILYSPISANVLYRILKDIV